MNEGTQQMIDSSTDTGVLPKNLGVPLTVLPVNMTVTSENLILFLMKFEVNCGFTRLSMKLPLSECCFF